MVLTRAGTGRARMRKTLLPGSPGHNDAGPSFFAALRALNCPALSCSSAKGLEAISVIYCMSATFCKRSDGSSPTLPFSHKMQSYYLDNLKVA
jgi:hypothetical protein